MFKRDFKPYNIADNIAELQKLLPNGELQGKQYVALNPTRYDRHLGSFTINTETMVWTDFATNDKGVGWRSLREYLKQGDSNPYQSKLPPFKATSSNCRTNGSYSPLPTIDNAPKANPNQPLCAGQIAYDYHNAGGELVGRIIRTDGANSSGGKKFTVMSKINGQWLYRAMPNPRPLYRLTQLLNRPNDLVIVCEGEKATDACVRIFQGDDIVAVCSSGGCKAWHHTDWSPLKNRSVFLWPDADEPGKNSMMQLKSHLMDLPIKKIKIATLHPNLPEGFDAADIPLVPNAAQIALNVMNGECL